jgi:glycosyltransferase involved in cell wall biosynthesis
VHPFSETRKGAGILRQAVSQLASDPKLGSLTCVVFGGGPRPAGSGGHDHWPTPLVHLGSIHDPRCLALAYRAANVMVVPSVQEGYGLVTAEALSCHTPVVAFRGTGADDLIVHGVTGYLAEAWNPETLAEGIRRALLAPRPTVKSGDTAMEPSPGPLHIHEVARRYLSLYQELLHPEVLTTPPQSRDA